MIATLEYTRAQFDKFNDQIFGCQLSVPLFKISSARTYVGKFAAKPIRQSSSLRPQLLPIIYMSDRFDLPEDQLQDVIIHEMIHYYIMAMGWRDTAPHGERFRSLMAEINQKHHRNITISVRNTEKSDPPQAAQQPIHTTLRTKWRVIAVVTLSSGQKGFKVLPSNANSIRKFHSMVKSSASVRDIELYLHDDPFFASFPSSAVPRLHIPDDMSTVLRLVTEAHRLVKVDNGYKAIPPESD